MIKEEEKILFYNNNALLGKFVIKYILKYFLYGYLFLSIAVIIFVLFNKLLTASHGYLKYLQFFWLIPISYCFLRFIRILSTTRYKWRLFRMAHYRLNTRAYSENYFKYEIYEPCMRLIIRDVLYEYNLRNEYKILKTKYLHVNQRIEDEKTRILSEVIRRNKQKQTQEV